MKARRGILGDELIATILVVILLAFFFASVISSYANFLSDIGFSEKQRIASAVAEKIYFENRILSDPVAALVSANVSGIKIDIWNVERGWNWTIDNRDLSGESVATASMAILMFNETEGMYYPGKIDVYVE